MSEHEFRTRSRAVFGAFLGDEASTLHPADHAEAAAFWNWLGDLEPPRAAAQPIRAAWPRRIAASLAAVALLGGGAAALWLTDDSPPEVAQAFATGHAERRRIVLSDASVVTLAADSRIEVAFVPGERRLRLTAGEALFKVAHNTARPFIVQTRHGEVRAVGTAFDVSVSGPEAEVTVVEGIIRIAVAEGGKADAAEPIEKLARKGERLSFGVSNGSGSSTSFIRQVADVDAETAVAWTRGQLVFRGEPLRAVIAKVNRYARQRIVLTDPAAGSTPVYGVVNQGDTDAVRELISNPDAVALDQRD